MPLCTGVTDSSCCLQVPTAASRAVTGRDSTRSACGPLRQTRLLDEASVVQKPVCQECVAGLLVNPWQIRTPSPVIVRKSFGLLSAL